MNGKIEFGCDFWNLFTELQYRSKSLDLRNFTISPATTTLFLVLWGFTTKETDEAYNLYNSRREAGRLDDLRDVVQRVINYVKPDPSLQDKLLVQLSAQTYIDFDVTEEEYNFFKVFSNSFDLRPSEINELAKQGEELAKALILYGDMYKSIN